MATETSTDWVPPLSVTGGDAVQVDSAGAPVQANEIVSTVPGSEANARVNVAVPPAAIDCVPPFEINL